MKKVLLQSVCLLSTFVAFAQPSKFENLGSKVNSPYSEVRPTISADGKVLYFVVEGNPKNNNYKKDKAAQDVWFSELDEAGNWSQAQPAVSPINGRNDNAIFWVSPDGNKLLIRGKYENGKFAGKGFSFIYKIAGADNNVEIPVYDSTGNQIGTRKLINGWSSPEGLNIKGYNQMAVDQYSGATMSNDGRTMILYFSEERNSFINDLYVTRYNDETEEWSRPERITGEISLDDYDEISPFLASDGMTLYFSSNRPGGKGEYDIWMTRRQDDSWKNWSSPVNMGDSINTKGWDAYFTIDAKGEYGYISNVQNKGNSDLFRIKLNDDQRPKTVVLVYGKVYNAQTKKPMDAKLVYDLIPGEKPDGNAIASPDGKFKVTLPYGHVYSLRASADKFFSVIDTIDLSKYDVYKEIHRDLYLNPVVEDGKVLLDSNGNIIRNNADSVLDNFNYAELKEGQILSSDKVLFDFGKSILRSDSYKELEKLARMMLANPSVQIELSAHTDNIGGYSDNLKLSDDRAAAAKQYLMSKGVAASRINSKGYGETTPVADNKTEVGRQQNRRVEFRILKK